MKMYKDQIMRNAERVDATGSVVTTPVIPMVAVVLGYHLYITSGI